ncbi:26849_t:CDS:2 [Racocetra persica]|uniref:26849_t:CDS:1 n=1 Tax=Racocetra persica TaxID=160502 RepID=A0ACA9R257_9GLOM|nr:26849_t:CDS:2 [Racocetra persica]
MNQKNPELNNNFSGSLKALENCKDLECMCIGNQPNIKGGLEFLPAEKLTYFVNVKHQNNKEKAIVELSKKIKESEKKLEEAKESEDDKTQKITRLESQIQILTEKEKERITN